MDSKKKLFFLQYLTDRRIFSDNPVSPKLLVNNFNQHVNKNCFVKTNPISI